MPHINQPLSQDSMDDYRVVKGGGFQGEGVP